MPPFAQDETRTIQMTGPTGGVPANATAVFGNLTVTTVTGSGHFVAWTADQPIPQG